MSTQETREFAAGDLLSRWKSGNGLPTLVGESGGRVEVTDIWESVRMFGHIVFATEFGTIYMDSDRPVQVLR
jgi:hypothetical protein